MNLRRLIIRLGMGFAAMWLIAVAGLVVFARPMIYPFTPGVSAAAGLEIPGEQVKSLTADDGLALSVWVVPPRGARPVILYFMGNSGDLPPNRRLLAELVQRGFGIAALNYRGAGGSEGAPSQDALTADALTVYDNLAELVGEPVEASRRVIYGTSLGAALAVQLAAQRPNLGLVLESPFNRLCEVAQMRFPIIPVCLLLPFERWASADRIGQVDAPVLILHGDADETIPLSQGEALFAAAREPKRLMIYPGARHNDLRHFGARDDAIEFIEDLITD